MISSGSLAAFSASVLNGASSVPATRPVQQAAAGRAPVQNQAALSSTSVMRPPAQIVPGQLAPGQNLPRGSLLDLSV
jgi:hypothetical protein